MTEKKDSDFNKPHPYTKCYGDGSPRGICRCGKPKDHTIHKDATSSKAPPLKFKVGDNVACADGQSGEIAEVVTDDSHPYRVGNCWYQEKHLQLWTPKEPVCPAILKDGKHEWKEFTGGWFCNYCRIPMPAERALTHKEKVGLSNESFNKRFKPESVEMPPDNSLLYGWTVDKRLSDFKTTATNLKAEGQTSRADVVLYLIERCKRAESKPICKIEPENYLSMKQALEDIHDISIGYDGFGTVKSLKLLVDELRELASKGLGGQYHIEVYKDHPEILKHLRDSAFKGE